MEHESKTICFPCVFGKEWSKRYASVKIEGEKVNFERHIFSPRVNAVLASPLNPFSGTVETWPSQNRWIGQFEFCSGCGDIGFYKSDDKMIDEINRLKPIAKCDRFKGDYFTTDRFVDIFNELYEKASPSTFKVVPFCEGYSSRCDEYNDYGECSSVVVRFSEFAAENKMDCYSYLREFNPGAWDLRDLEDSPDAKRIRELRRIEMYELQLSHQRAVDLAVKANQERKEAIIRNRKKLNKRHLIAISRIGIASKLKNLCTP